jgi:hypothetical protein
MHSKKFFAILGALIAGVLGIAVVIASPPVELAIHHCYSTREEEQEERIKIIFIYLENKILGRWW